MVSVFEMLKIGIGPSSSHTLGPWRAAEDFVRHLKSENTLSSLTHLTVTLLGSLAYTGKGHYTDKAIIAGLSGMNVTKAEPEEVEKKFLEVLQQKILQLSTDCSIEFDFEKDFHFNINESYTVHPNTMYFSYRFENGTEGKLTYYSTGGGFIQREGVIPNSDDKKFTYGFTHSDALLKLCHEKKWSVSDYVFENEKLKYNKDEIVSGMLRIWYTMRDAAYKGCHTQGILPGGLGVIRRAYDLNKNLLRTTQYSNPAEWTEAMKIGNDFSKIITRISCLAIAVNETNATLGRVVTAPTNGSAGVIPAVLFYYICFSGKNPDEEKIVRFLLTAAEIGKYFKLNATISAAVGGCQAEIGVSSAMAAAALTEGLGGNVAQVLMAAEIAAEHHLGLTCDPVGGLVQIPCIERNSMGAIKAITAAMIAIASDETKAKVSLDSIIKVMKETADHMNTKFKETSQAGLAMQIGVNIPEC